QFLSLTTNSRNNFEQSLSSQISHHSCSQCLEQPTRTPTTAYTNTRTTTSTPPSMVTAMRSSTGLAATLLARCPSQRAATGPAGHLPLALAGLSILFIIFPLYSSPFFGL